MDRTVRSVLFGVFPIVVVITIAYLLAPVAGAEAATTVSAGPGSQESMEQVPVECDAAAGRLDDAVIETRKLEGAYLIIVARLGTREPSGLNRVRLANVEEYLRRRGSDLKYVLAEGSRVKGLGRTELYVGGRLSRLMPFAKHAKGYCIPGREGW